MTQTKMTEIDFQVVQVYASMKYWKIGQKLSRPLTLGTYPAQTETHALQKAAHDWQLPTQLLFATLVQERKQVDDALLTQEF